MGDVLPFRRRTADRDSPSLDVRLVKGNQWRHYRIRVDNATGTWETWIDIDGRHRHGLLGSVEQAHKARARFELEIATWLSSGWTAEG
jgi:hypothetical protein